jgi:hypothetical protein
MGQARATATHAAVYPSHLESPRPAVAAKEAAPRVSETGDAGSGTRYRVYLIGRGIEIGGVEELVAGGDQDAIAAAHRLIEAPPNSRWSGFTLIGPMARIVTTWRR